MKNKVSILTAMVLPFVAFAADPPYDPAAPPDAFQIGIATNTQSGDSVINLGNAGTTGTSVLGFGFNFHSAICVNTYVYSPDERLEACCSCRVVANSLNSYSVVNDLISNTLTGIIPRAVVIKLVATEPKNLTCNPGVPGVLVSGLSVWATTLHAAPTTPVTYTATDSPFHNKILSTTEYLRLTNNCSLIQASGSEFGICKVCRFGGL